MEKDKQVLEKTIQDL